MSDSNWLPEWPTVDVSPNQNEYYQLDNVGLQIQLGLPIQLIGMSGAVRSVTGNGVAQNQQRPPRVNKTRNRARSEFIQHTVDGIPIRKIYVTNILLEVQKQDLLYVFSNYGIITETYLARSKSQPTKQFAFITYRHPRDASRVLEQHNHTDHLGRKIYVSAADSWHQPQEDQNGKLNRSIDYRKNHSKSQDEDSEEDEPAVDAVTGQLKGVVLEEGLNALNDDCLLHIFSFLSYKEIAGIERVCKRWQGLSWRLWRCLRKLSYKEPTFPRMGADTQTLSEYLRRCGEGITELDLGLTIHSFNEKTLPIIAKHCSNLEVLRVTNLAVGNRGLAHLGHRCFNIKTLVMEGCVKFSDQDLMSLLPKCSQLIDLELSRSSNFTGKCLAKISSPLTNLTLENCSSVSVSCLIAGLEKVSDSLKSLNLSASVDLRNSDMSKIISAVPNLTSLSLCRCHPHPYTDHLTTLSPIGLLTKLTSLNLYLNSAVSDSLLTTVVEGCLSLITINLGGCGQGRLSEQGLLVLSRLRSLKNLDISYLECATDGALKALSSRCTRLHSLICRGCPYLSDEGCCLVVSMCNELKLFDLSGCNAVGELTLEAAITSVKMRTNNISLRLILGGTNVESVASAADVSLLEVDMMDLSEDHLRPDFIDDMFFPPTDSEDEEDLDHLLHIIGQHLVEEDLLYGSDDSDDDDDEYTLDISGLHAQFNLI